MLTKEGCRKRIERLVDRLPRRLAALVLADPKNIHRLVNFFPTTALAGNDTLHFALVRRDGHTTLVVDNWQKGPAEQSFADAVEVCPWYTMTVPPRERRRAVAEHLVDLLARHGLHLEPLGIEESAVPSYVARRLADTEDVTELILSERACKDADEVACIGRAVAVNEAAHAAARREARDGLSEIELVSHLAQAAALAAGEPVELLGDFASGERSIVGGGPATARLLRDGELLILDLFPIVGGYRADTCATLCVGGRPTPRQQEVFAVLREAQQAGEKALQPGQTAGQVYRAVQSVIAAAGYADLFGHHAGHGIGTGHPESPFFVPESTEPIRAGQVVTLEPGIYIPGWGGLRIEHDYLVTPAGAQRLSQHHLGL